MSIYIYIYMSIYIYVSIYIYIHIYKISWRLFDEVLFGLHLNSAGVVCRPTAFETAFETFWEGRDGGMDGRRV